MAIPRVEPHPLTPVQVAKRFNVSVETVYRWILTEQLPALDCRGLGKAPRWRMSESAIAEFAEKRARG